jgi:hypothetical protein
MLRRFVMDSHLIGEVQLYSLASLVRRALSGGLEVSDLFVAGTEDALYANRITDWEVEGTAECWCGWSP